MESIPALGRVSFLPVRQVWPEEASSFTPWLLENEQHLADLLGIDLTLTANEHRVGNFSLDLIGTNLTDGSTLIVENQLARTDHSHLGQLLTYAGGLEPSTVVWIATEFRDEHRAALDWLNQVTDDRTHFFGVVVKAIQIDDSAAAPWLELVVQPNEWTELTRRAAESHEASEAKDRYQRFWQGFLNRHQPSFDFLANKRPVGHQYLTIPTGIGGITIGMNIQRNRIYVDLYFYGDPDRNLARLKSLEAHRELVEDIFGDALSWEELENRRACRVGFYGEGSIMDEESWVKSQDWLVDVAGRFKRVTETEAFKQLRSVS